MCDECDVKLSTGSGGGVFVAVEAGSQDEEDYPTGTARAEREERREHDNRKCKPISFFPLIFT